ncbi:MAG: hypothetical protein GY884_34180 [Proteobacteria bacterium]|nr:hypothetical protein [Pseudomonadota bacterium]
MAPLVRALHTLGEQLAEVPLVDLSTHLASALPSLPVDDRDRTLLHYALLLALAPRATTGEAVDAMKEAGWSERAIHDVVHVVCCFSYMNRLADGLGVTLVDVDRHEWAVELFGEAALRAHFDWGRVS